MDAWNTPKKRLYDLIENVAGIIALAGLYVAMLALFVVAA